MHQAQQQFTEAQSLFDNGDYFAALNVLEHLNAAYPNQKNILFAQARCYERMGDIEKAVTLCETCMSLEPSPRVEEMLNRLRRESSPMNDLIGETSSAFNTPVLPMKSRRHFPGRLMVILILGVLTIGLVGAFSWQLIVVSERDTETSSNFQAALNQKLSEKDGPSKMPGQLIREAVWKRTAINGLPAWKPGIYRDVPCSGNSTILRDGVTIPLTMDAYIPMAYQERPNDLFPVVMISNPEMNPGFIGLENWAEQNDVILAVVNGSMNGPYALNFQAQDAVLLTISESMRADRTMGFAIGMSGGGASSWEMICRYPQHFAGVVLMGIGRGHLGNWVPQHVRVAYIYGESDFNREWIEQTIPQLRKKGNQVRAQRVPGGHVSGPLNVREEMLTWMLNDARADR